MVVRINKTFIINKTYILIPNNHVTNSLDLLHKIQENLDIVHNIEVVGKHGYFTSKTGSSHTSAYKAKESETANIVEVEDLSNEETRSEEY